MIASIYQYTPPGPYYTIALINPGATAGQSLMSHTTAQLQVMQFVLSKVGSPTGYAYAQLYSSAGTFNSSSNGYGTLLATSNPVDVSTIAASEGWQLFQFSGANRYEMANDTAYIIAVTCVASSPGNYIRMHLNSAPGTSGVFIYKTNASMITDPNSDAPYIVTADTGPRASFTSNVAEGVPPLSVSFTDTSLYSPTSWAWNFGDGGTSAAQNPTHNYTSPGLYDVVLTATNSKAADVETKVAFVDVAQPITGNSISSSSSVGQPTLTLTDPPPPPPTDWSALGKEDEKVYVYKVYKSDGTYLGIWTDVLDDLEFTQRLNTPGTTTTVRLARSANTRKEVRDSLAAENTDILVTEDGSTLVALSETSNTVGEDTDVELNYKVEVYVHYGEFASLTTELNELITTENGDEFLVTIGAPLGTRIFSGFVLDYESVYGGEAGVTVTLASHGMDLSNEVVRTGEITTVTYTTTALEAIAKSILDTNPGAISYSTQSIDATGVSETFTFKLNTKLEGLETIYDQTPDGWYWYVNVAENTLYLKPVSSGYDHVFMIGEHIKELRVKRSIEDLKNEVYFVGGEVGGTVLYKKYSDAASQTAWRKGVERITDRRYKLAASMQRRADKLIGRYKNPIYTSPLTISSARYDIESIQLGQTVGFRNFDNFIDELPPLQIVSRSYTPYAVTIELGELQDRSIDMVAETEESLAVEQYDTIPNAPS